MKPILFDVFWTSEVTGKTVKIGYVDDENSVDIEKKSSTVSINSIQETPAIRISLRMNDIFFFIDPSFSYSWLPLYSTCIQRFRNLRLFSQNGQLLMLQDQQYRYNLQETLQFRFYLQNSMYHFHFKKMFHFSKTMASEKRSKNRGMYCQKRAKRKQIYSLYKMINKMQMHFTV